MIDFSDVGMEQDFLQAGSGFGVSPFAMSVKYCGKEDFHYYPFISVMIRSILGFSLLAPTLFSEPLEPSQGKS